MSVDRRIQNSPQRVLGDVQQRLLRVEQRLYPLTEPTTDTAQQVTFLLPGAVTDEEVGPWVAHTRVVIREVALGCLTAGSGSGATVDIIVNGTVKDTVTIGASSTSYTEVVEIGVNENDRVSVQATSVASDMDSLSVGIRWG